MKIVVLDGYALNPGDLSWQALEALGDCTVYDRTTPDQTVQRAAGAEILLTNKTVLSADMLEQLPDCKYIGVLATGFNIVDTGAAAEKNIIVANVPTYSTQSVAQMVFAHVLNLTQHVGEHSRTAREGKWIASPDFCYWDYPLIELAGKTMGVIGLGRIGQATAKLALAFGMNVIGYTRNPDTCVAAGVSPVTLNELLTTSDVVTLHCPLTDETQGMINAASLAKMKPTAFLINTSRGPLVDQRALAEALNEGRIAGAGLDVLNTEPPPADNPLLSAKNCSITPHIAWATKEARARLMNTSIENVKAFLSGAPQNVVNCQ
ncbi:MAG: D-2-hydroxyacid dehydrogenase [Phycisphaerae bacterium]|jgi:glycerate dehydrogenase|nr:D-2-hydroxyacid dehydrogenase [Phycisphaerae bacterium]